MRARPNLIITKAGSHSLHMNWLLGERNFDLMVVAYQPGVMEAGLANPVEGVTYSYAPSPKVVGWKSLFASQPELFDRYERIALLDDDLDTNAAALSRCFDIGAAHELLIWQPSLTWDSYTTFAGLLQNPAFSIRYVNYIEMMCPFFQSRYLKDCLPLFDMGYETGPDLVWCSLAEADARRFAVIDSVALRHTRPIGAKKAINGFADKTYEDDIHACLAEFDMRWPSLVSDRAILRNGKMIASRLLISSLANLLLAAPLKAPAGEHLKHWRIVADHIRHQLTRPPAYGDRNKIIQRLSAI